MVGGDHWRSTSPGFLLKHGPPEQVVTGWLLNLSREEDFIASLGSLLQCSVTIKMQVFLVFCFFLIANQNVIRICYSIPVVFTNLLNYIFCTFLDNSAGNSSGCSRRGYQTTTATDMKINRSCSCTEPTNQHSVKIILPGKIVRSSKDLQIYRIHHLHNFYKLLSSFRVQNLYLASHLDMSNFKLPALSSDQTLLAGLKSPLGTGIFSPQKYLHRQSTQ